jgi:hypothetical protein
MPSEVARTHPDGLSRVGSSRLDARSRPVGRWRSQRSAARGLGMDGWSVGVRIRNESGAKAFAPVVEAQTLSEIVRNSFLISPWTRPHSFLSPLLVPSGRQVRSTSQNPVEGVVHGGALWGQSNGRRRRVFIQSVFQVRSGYYSG